MECPRCRQRNADEARFCMQCGAGLSRTCGRCATELGADAAFCSACGHPAPAFTPAARFAAPGAYTPRRLAAKILTSRAALEGERKQVTILFADMKGSLALIADRDPEEVRTILDPVLTLMMDAVHRYEGTVNQVMGDGIMALFGAPVAHEDHAVRACHAALRMQDAVKRGGEEMRRAHGVVPQIRVGLNSGEVVVGSIGSDLRMNYTAIGPTTHLAARMEEIAAAGSVVISAETCRLAHASSSSSAFSAASSSSAGRRACSWPAGFRRPPAPPGEPSISPAPSASGTARPSPDTFWPGSPQLATRPPSIPPSRSSTGPRGWLRRSAPRPWSRAAG